MSRLVHNRSDAGFLTQGFAALVGIYILEFSHRLFLLHYLSTKAKSSGRIPAFMITGYQHQSFHTKADPFFHLQTLVLTSNFHNKWQTTHPLPIQQLQFHASALSPVCGESVSLLFWSMRYYLAKSQVSLFLLRFHGSPYSIARQRSNKNISLDSRLNFRRGCTSSKTHASRARP